MKLRILILFLLLISVFLELSLTSFPLIFLFTYVLFSIEYRYRYLIPAGILSIAGDAVLLHPLGATLVLVSIFQLSIYLYARYLGSRDALVYILFGVIGLVGYAIIFGYPLLDLFKWFLVAGILWIIYRLLPKRLSL